MQYNFKKQSLLASFITLSVIVNAQFSVDNMQKVRFDRNNATDKICDMHLADFNGDGNIDVVLDGGLPINISGVTVFNSKPIFFLGDGNGHLIPTSSTFTHTGTTSFITDVGDYNRDGYPDLLVTEFWANGMRLYKGSAGLNFTLAQTLPTGTHGAKGKFEDMDGDGDLDIVNISSGSASLIQFHFFENTGATFAGTTYNSIGNSDGMPTMFITDLNHDGRKDVFGISYLRKTLATWIQNPDKTFTVGKEDLNISMHSGGNEYLTYWLDDANGDGFNDLHFYHLITNPTFGAGASVAYNRPMEPYFASALDASGPPDGNYLFSAKQTLIAEDLDKDGTKDIIIVNRRSSNQDIPQEIVIVKDPLNRNGNYLVQTLDFGLFSHIDGGKTIRQDGFGMILADLDKDNDLELISAGVDDTLRIFNNGFNIPPTGIGKITSGNFLFSIYPNPATDFLKLDIDEQIGKNIAQVVIYDMHGALLQTIDQKNWQKGLNIRPLSSGNYMLSLKMKNGESFSKMFSKMQ